MQQESFPDSDQPLVQDLVSANVQGLGPAPGCVVIKEPAVTLGKEGGFSPLTKGRY